jgi:hypothetical protein
VTDLKIGVRQVPEILSTRQQGVFSQYVRLTCINQRHYVTSTSPTIVIRIVVEEVSQTPSDKLGTMELGPELFELLNSKQWVGNRTPVIYGARGLSSEQIVSIEAQLGFRMPDDFAYLFQNLQDPGRVLFPWSEFDKGNYDEKIKWVLRGVEFDIERNHLWLERWGTKPDALSTALNIARKDFDTWPRLLPIYGHRFLAAQPCRSGNPVLSIMQTDVIYYGADLPHYLLNEFVDHDYALHTHAQNIRKIDVWSDFAEA